MLRIADLLRHLRLIIITIRKRETLSEKHLHRDRQ